MTGRPSPLPFPGLMAFDGFTTRSCTAWAGLGAVALGLLSGAVWAQAPNLDMAAASAPALAQAASAPASTAMRTASTTPKSPAPTAKPFESPVLAIAPNWQRLKPEQQRILAPLASDWDAMDAARRGKWLEVAARYPQLPLDEQARVQERMVEWARLSPQARQQARIGYQTLQQAKPGESLSKLERWEAYQSLPESRKQALAAKAAQKASAAPADSKPLASAQTQVHKSNLVPKQTVMPPTDAGQVSAPSLIQAKPGASTVPLARRSTPPKHQPAGQPKVLTDPALVDPQTLLPRAAARPASAPN